MKNLRSVVVPTLPGIGSQKDGQPVPLSNFVLESNNDSPQPAQMNAPWRFSSLSGLVKARSVPCWRSTLYCKGSSDWRHSLSLRGVWFQWKVPKEHGDEARRQMGMIAQEVEKVIPEWVLTDKDGYRYLSTNGFPALAVEAMREMKNENDTLKAHVSDLEKRLARLESALSEKHATAKKSAKGE